MPLTATPTPTPQPTPPSIWGDTNCSNGVDSVDALLVLRYVVQLPIGDQCDADKDVDCSGAVNAIDALKVLRYAASLSVSQTQPCPVMGAAD
jgi:hypothetical protein